VSIEQLVRNRRLATGKIWPRPDATVNSRMGLGTIAKASASSGMHGDGANAPIRSYGIAILGASK
jgi:hypothetical protein